LSYWKFLPVVTKYCCVCFVLWYSYILVTWWTIIEKSSAETCLKIIVFYFKSSKWHDVCHCESLTMVLASMTVSGMTRRGKELNKSGGTESDFWRERYRNCTFKACSFLPVAVSQYIRLDFLGLAKKREFMFFPWWFTCTGCFKHLQFWWLLSLAPWIQIGN
jgi:hypothetical protein